MANVKCYRILWLKYVLNYEIWQKARNTNKERILSTQICKNTLFFIEILFYLEFSFKIGQFFICFLLFIVALLISKLQIKTIFISNALLYIDIKKEHLKFKIRLIRLVWSNKCYDKTILQQQTISNLTQNWNSITNYHYTLSTSLKFQYHGNRQG